MKTKLLMLFALILFTPILLAQSTESLGEPECWGHFPPTCPHVDTGNLFQCHTQTCDGEIRLHEPSGVWDACTGTEPWPVYCCGLYAGTDSVPTYETCIIGEIPRNLIDEWNHSRNGIDVLVPACDGRYLPLSVVIRRT